MAYFQINGNIITLTPFIANTLREWEFLSVNSDMAKTQKHCNVINSESHKNAFIYNQVLPNTTIRNFKEAVWKNSVLKSG